MPPSDFANADIPDVVRKLTLDEAILLTAGVGSWHTHEVPRLGIPAIKVSDGPNGVRGNHYFMGTPAKCLPAATALGSTWDPELIEEVALKLLAEECKSRAVSILLAPTCNIQRNPLGGRSFESFAEDPHLSGMISAAYVNGLQQGGIGACIKHFVCNDKELDRRAYDVIVSPRALREIYLMPFMLAQKHAKPWSYMTAYNRINGTHCSENSHLIRNILRGDWGFDGMVMSDWYGVYSIDHSINAGLDLEMPGVNKWRTLDLMNRSVGSRKIMARTVKERAGNVLELVKKCAAGAPEILDGDKLEHTRESPSDTLLMRKLASSSIVLLKNAPSSSTTSSSPLLPLNPQKIKKIAIIGGNAKAVVLSGGGSAALKPSYWVSPFDGIVNALGKDVEVAYAEGSRTYKMLPTLDYNLRTKTGARGWTGTWYAHESDTSLTPLSTPFKEEVIDEIRVFISTEKPKGLTRSWTLKLEGIMEVEKGGEWEFGLTVAGRAKLYIDGNLVVDNWTRQTRGTYFFNYGTPEVTSTYPLLAKTPHHVLVEFCNVRGPADGDEDEAIMETNPGVRLGGAEVRFGGEEGMLEEAEECAKGAEVAVVVVGLNSDWETEGGDRETLALPGKTDELVERVVKANPNTIVVTQAGSSITMPWADSVPAIVHSWYLGNATGDAIADVLFGKFNPCGKLSLTFPKRLEDVPAHGHYHSENGKIRYGEDLFVGYKHFAHRKIEPAFSFGHGLSYTTFSYTDLKFSKPTLFPSDITLTASVTVTNTGSLPGSEIVQLYISYPPTSDLTHPPLMLKAFAKVKDLGPGESRVAQVKLDKYAVSYWEERIERWVVERGWYSVRVGRSSEEMVLEGGFEVGKGFEWDGL
ncbi:glycoside hydrolase family 3 protein [Jaapia argillacea MUCL 33604]|uniref:beta-glucosidase n=1 Tax=Jaapia argillacea MUCL 33604 TaxID=933084 RepID=A0A067PZ55_9AGAM|nr:glycoside hydrolase family 3 protein [Jaapia argillacea MUCL 33604]